VTTQTAKYQKQKGSQRLHGREQQQQQEYQKKPVNKETLTAALISATAEAVIRKFMGSNIRRETSNSSTASKFSKT
jgi:hypothetical protein